MKTALVLVILLALSSCQTAPTQPDSLDKMIEQLTLKMISEQ